jgi:two-component system CheB/CheR fusion protein
MDQAVLVLDADLSIDFANSAYCRMFEVERGDLEGAQFYEVAEGQWDVPRLRKLLEQMLPNRSAVRDYRVTIHMPDGAKEPLSVSARLIRYDGEERIMLTVRSSAGSLDAGAEGAEA